MLNLKLDIEIDALTIDMNILLGNECIDGGIYIFLIDDIPLYIGEASIFLSRLSYHLQQLKEDVSYFGLETLGGQHKITYSILESGYPYKEEKIDKKRASDLNKKARQDKEQKYIQDFYPLTQHPKFLDDNQIITIFKNYDKERGKKYFKRNYDCMLPHEERSKSISACFNEHLSKYDKIKEDIYKLLNQNLHHF